METNHDSPRRLPGVIAKLLLLSISMSLGVGAVEVVMRVLVAVAPEVMPIDFVADPELQSLPKIQGMMALKRPNQHATFNGKFYRTNSRGARGPEYEVPKPSSVFRTVIVGDSFTMGSGVDEEDTYSARLQGRLDANDSNRKHEVVNLGVGGFNMDAIVARLRLQGLRLQPDLVVYGWTYNDIESSVYRKTSSPIAPAVTGLLFEKLARDRITAVRDMFYPATDSYVAELDQNYFRNDAAWKIFTEGLDNFALIASSERVCAVMLLHTGLYSLNRFHPFQRFYDVVAEAAEERGIYVVRTFDRYKGLEPKSMWIHPTDSHPNAEGHRILADALGETIEALPAGCLKADQQESPEPSDTTTLRR